MPYPASSASGYFGAADFSDVYKEVEVTIDISVGTADLWTPNTGKRFVLKGFDLISWCSVIHVGATDGSYVALCDNAIATRVIASIGTISTSTHAVGDVLINKQVYYGAGIPSATVNNVLRAIMSATGTSGSIAIRGTVWGVETD